MVGAIIAFTIKKKLFNVDTFCFHYKEKRNCHRTICTLIAFTINRNCYCTKWTLIAVTINRKETVTEQCGCVALIHGLPVICSHICSSCVTHFVGLLIFILIL